MFSAQEQSARDLMHLLERLMQEECGCLSLVSELACRDVITHHERDLRDCLHFIPKAYIQLSISGT